MEVTSVDVALQDRTEMKQNYDFNLQRMTQQLDHDGVLDGRYGCERLRETPNDVIHGRIYREDIDAPEGGEPSLLVRVDYEPGIIRSKRMESAEGAGYPELESAEVRDRVSEYLERGWIGNKGVPADQV